MVGAGVIDSAVTVHADEAPYRTDVEVTSRIRQHEARGAVRPSARTNSAFLPYRPESSNPQKIIEHRDWDLFVIDLPKINAFVLRSYLYDLMGL